MKQAILTFDRCSVLLVELPEGAYGVGQQHIYHGENPITYHIEGHGDKNYVFRFPGFVDLVSKLSELTEEQAREIVDSWQRYFPEQHTVYRNYEYPIEYDHIKGREQRWSHPFGNAVESFLSKLRADGFRCEFNHEEKPEFTGDRDVDKALQDSYDVQQERGFTPDLTWVFTIKQ